MPEFSLSDVIWGGALSLLAAIMCVALHYEGLNLLERFANYERRWLKNPRPRLLLVMMGVVLLHTLEIWVIGAFYAFVVFSSNLGQIQIAPGLGEAFTLWDYVYFSAVMYTSLGIGDLVPLGVFKMLAATEALVGLILIAWSASFTYLLMQRLWGDRNR